MKAFYENIDYKDKVSIHAGKTRNLNFVAHWHSDIEMLYICEGSVGVGINSEYKILHEGDISICGSNDIHYYNNVGEGSKGMMIIFKSKVLNESKYWGKDITPCSICIEKKHLEENKLNSSIANIFMSVINEVETKNEQSYSFAKLRVSELVLLLFRSFPSYYQDIISKSAIPSSTETNPMQQALRHIENNYDTEITLEKISSYVGLSSYYFSRLFKNTTGTNFKSYLTHSRISKAEELIKTTKKHIIDIAYETGFSSIRTFNRSFKELKGYTPKSARKI
ncbi:MAG: helix-turn-helix transcriptional regulator [Clostridiales bacterium]|nr:helix-turn-helix transcriptional regulator [Clostridiales bacterium]